MRIDVKNIARAHKVDIAEEIAREVRRLMAGTLTQRLKITAEVDLRGGVIVYTTEMGNIALEPEPA